MKNEGLISIIIPVFNAGQYIGNCLQMLKKQTYNYYQILCIDDGSTDESSKIIKAFADRDSRIQYYYQANKGAGSARNLGIKKALGDYLLFLDADDLYEQEMLELVVNNAKENQADIVVFNADQFDSQTNKTDNRWSAVSFRPLNKNVISAGEAKKCIFNFTIPAPWNKLFKKSFLNDKQIFFQEISSTNDLFFSYAMLCNAERISIMDEKLIHYRTNNISSIQGNKNKNIYDAFKALICLKKYLQHQSMYLLYEDSYIKMACSIIVYTLARSDDIQFREIISNPTIVDYIQNMMKAYGAEDIEWVDEIIIVYGAGVLAQVFVRYLKKIILSNMRIYVVVSNKTEVENEIYGIRVKSIEELTDYRNNVIFICASNEKSRREMEKNAQGYKFEKIEHLSDVTIINMLFHKHI